MLPFTGNPLNRASERRADAAWIAERRQRGLILPLARLQVLVSGESVLRAARVRAMEEFAGAPSVFLGLEGEAALFAVDVSACSDAAERFAPHGVFRELRAAAALLDLGDLAILSQAKAMIDWHARHGFCARCGAPTTPGDAGYKRICTPCGAEHFPRTDPAVIMLAICGERCLLARNKAWGADFYSALAGFVEPGETFEEAVRRELFEEAGVTAGEVTYYACQPWPFPSSLMIGCFAQCARSEVTLDGNELVDSVWLTRAEARDLLDGKMAGRRGPFPAAIAHHLVRAWVEGRESSTDS
ncbi:MAG: NAD(+) diphosphatase [Alphaproteobacteria bacterium]|nr:NAD(+) diphosphatase [Alphaproteobacteria bacterium]